jgi:putative PIN family toxin of toxin-antitoxin system
VKPAPRVVLATNVALSALVFARGRLGPLRGAWQQERCRPLISAATLAELVRALGYPKFRLSPDEQHELLADYVPYCTTVRMPARPPRTPPCRDPADAAFLQLVVDGQADHLVTGDQDLLSLAPAFRRSIISPRALLAML